VSGDVEAVARMIARGLGHNDDAGIMWERYVIPARIIVREFRAADDVQTKYDRERLRRLEWMFEGLSRGECRRRGIDPDDSIADGGHLAWHLAGYEAACREIPIPPAASPARAGA
jgi:hypothetical protein